MLFSDILNYNEGGGDNMKMGIRTFIEALRTETLGFSFGNPWRYDEQAITCVLPVVRESSKERGYLTFPEAKQIEVKDMGSISKAVVTNNEEKAVFIRVGTLLKGATQERATAVSRVIMPKETVEIAVVCVHASKGIVPGAKFDFGGYVPRRDGEYLGAAHTGRQVSQNVSWAMDRTYSTNLCSAAPDSLPVGSVVNDDLVSSLDKTKEVFKDVIEKMPLVDSQIGIAMIGTKGLHSLECYDLHASWKAVKEEIAGKESLSLAEKDESGVFEYKPEKAKDAVKEVLKKAHADKSQVVNEHSEILTLRYDGYVGEVALLGGEVIHLLITKG